MNLPSTKISTRDAVLNFVIEFKRMNDGNSPNPGEIAEALMIARPTVIYHLRKLSSDRLIEYRGGRIFVEGGKWTHKKGSTNGSN